ncbi:MAG: hypothetical protein HYV35_04190 [Lentisphaerae bacterium]|nr:hypothetical protein [Lentisphaerota bacterium]
MPLLAGIIAVVAPVGAFAQTTNIMPFTDGFENFTNQTPLINGTNGWYGSSSNIIVQTNIVRTGAKAAIIPTDSTLSNRFQGLTTTNVWVQVDCRPSVYEGTNYPTVDTNVVVMLYVNSNGYVVVHNGSTTNPAASTNWVTTTSMVGTNNWVTFGIYEDFAAKTWDLYVNGLRITNNLGFIDTSKTNFTGFDVYSGSSTAYLDNVSVKAPGTIIINPTNLYYLAMLGRSVTNQSITLTSQTGAWNFVNSTSVSWLSVGLVSSVVDSVTGASNVVVSCATQSVGSYTGVVTVSATNTDGLIMTPKTATVVMDIANLQLSPDLTNVVMLGNTPTQRTFNVINAGAGTVTYSVATNASWVASSSNGGTLGAYSTNVLTLTFANTAGWTPGASNATITVASSDGGGSTQTISVLLNVMDLRATPSGLTNVVMLGNTPTQRTFNVINAGVGSFTYTLATNASWIASSSNGGTLGANSTNVLTLTFASTAGWTPGASNATITVASSDGGGSTQTISVLLNVMGLSVSPAGLTNNAMVGNTPPNKTFNVINTGAGSLTYTVATNASWIAASSNGGTLGANSTNVLTLTFANTAGWTPGASNATVTVASSDGGGATQTVSVLLNLMVMQVSPTQLTNNVMKGLTSSQTFNVANPGSGVLSYTINTNVYDWVSLSQTAGALTNAFTNTIAVSYSTNLAYGTTTGLLTVASSSGGGATQYVSLVVNVNDLLATPSALTNNVLVGYTPSSQSFTLANPGPAPFTYTLLTNVTWVDCVDPDNGVFLGPDTNTITVNYGSTSNWVPGVSNATVTIVSTNYGGATQTVEIVLNVQELLPPAGVAASDGTYSDKVRVTWSAVTNASSYQVWRHTANDSAAATNLGTTTDTTFDDSNAVAEVTYYYWLKSTNNLGESAFSTPDTGVRALGAPPAPTGLTASDGAYADKIALSWTASSNAVGYEVWRNTSSDTGTATKVSSSDVTDTSYNDTSASASVLYTFWVKAKDSNAIASVFSASDTGWRGVLSPTVNASKGLRREVAVSWTESPGATSYELFKNTADDSSTAVLLGSGAALAYRDTNVMTRVRYYYWVKAVGALGDSGLGSSAVGWSGAAKWDFNGDGRADPWYYHEPSGRWYMMMDTNSFSTTVLGAAGWIPVPADYDGDGQTDVAVYQDPSGVWQVLLSSSGNGLAVLPDFGGAGYAPAMADYDGDGKTDPAIYAEASGTLQALLSDSGYQVAGGSGFGGPGYQPVPDNYDDDGKADPALYHEASGNWLISLSANGYQVTNILFGQSGYVPVPGEYDGLGYAQVAVYHDASGNWYIRTGPSEYDVVFFGQSGYIPLPADYDGDHYDDECVFYRTRRDASWYLLKSTEGFQTISGRSSRR